MDVNGSVHNGISLVVGEQEVEYKYFRQKWDQILDMDRDQQEKQKIIDNIKEYDEIQIKFNKLSQIDQQQSEQMKYMNDQTKSINNEEYHNLRNTLDQSKMRIVNDGLDR